MKKFDINFKGAACYEAQRWYAQFDSFEEAWNVCHRGDWMLWIASRLLNNTKELYLAKALCANTVRHKINDNRSIAAIDAAIAYGKNEIDIMELNAAANAAATISASAIDSEAYDAAANAASDSEAYVVPAFAAYAASDGDTRAKKENQMQTANICKAILTKQVFEKIKILNT